MRKIIIFLVLFLLSCGLAGATTLEVGTDKTYATVNAALSAASSGDTILLYPGTYTEKLTIQNIHDLTIQGVESPTIMYTPAKSDASPVILIGQNAYNISIKGLHIINDGSWTWYSGGIRASTYLTYGLDFEDNIIETVSGDGIWLHPTGNNMNTNYLNCNDSIIKNNTVRTTGVGRGICIYAFPTNITIDGNNVSVSDNWTFMSETNGASYGLKLQDSFDSVVKNNIVNCASYSLICCCGNYITVENNTAYGKATHNCYELGYRGGIFRNNTLIDTNRTWAYSNSGRTISLNNFYNPGGVHDHNMVIENIHAVNSTEGRIFSIGGHEEHVTMKNTTIDAPNHNSNKLIIYGFSGSAVQGRTSDGIILDNITITNHSSSSVPPFFVQGAGTDLSPTTHSVGDLSDITRDTITFYDVSVPINSYSSDIGVYADGADTNVSLIIANSELSTSYSAISSGSIECSIEDYYFTDIDITDGGQPASTSRIFIASNTTRQTYNEQVPYFTGNYIDPSQDNYTYQQTANGKLDSPEYIETLSNGQTGTRATPSNCVLLASTTKGRHYTALNTYTASLSDVYYNLSVYGGDFNLSYFYTTPIGTDDIITVDSEGTYAHKYGTKNGFVNGYHPTSTQYKTNSYERGTVDLTIPITEYEKTVIPMGMTM